MSPFRTTLRCSSVVLASSMAFGALAGDRFCVSDTGTAAGTDDRIWALEDLNGDGDFNDAGEVTAYYDEALGGIALSNGNGVSVGADGAVYVCDSTEDIVLRLRDLNADGDANDAGESNVFFHSLTNAMGNDLTAALNVFADATGVVWVANPGTTGVDDSIVRLEDLNADGDADDLNESRDYYVPSPGGASANTLPTGVIVGHDGRVYYTEGSTNGTFAKGLYRLDDLDASGTIDAPAEVTPYFIPPAGPATAFHWCVKVDAQGYYYMNDTGNERLWRGKDLDNSGSIDPATEAVVWYSVGAASNMWQIAFASNGDLLAAEDQTPDRILRLDDADTGGTIGAGEVSDAYNNTVAATVIASPRSIDLLEPGIQGAPFCAGDGLDPAVTTPCPCANFGAPGRGCANSAVANGALLTATGTSNPDTAVLQGSGMPAVVSCIYLQGDALDDIVFGDGVRCAGGSLLRLRTKANVGGASEFPDSTDTISLSARGGVTPGSGAVRYYQTYYRNAAATFCPPETFNVTNGFRITW